MKKTLILLVTALSTASRRRPETMKKTLILLVTALSLGAVLTGTNPQHVFDGQPVRRTESRW